VPRARAPLASGALRQNGDGMPEIVLSALHLYPLKSAGGVELRTARLDARGITGDRRWMVVDAGRMFITQRTHPRLALIRVAPGAGGLTLSARGTAPLEVPAPPATGRRVEVQVWDDICCCLWAGDAAAAWLSELLGEDVGLVFMPDDEVRIAPAVGVAPASPVGLADSHPFLLISEASLEDLNARMAAPVPMNRFRPNLVVRGCAPYAEDGWRRIRIGAIDFTSAKPCSRCTTTIVDQDSGVRGRDPLATLARYRRVGREVMFGQKLVHLATGELRVGDAVTVLETV